MKYTRKQIENAVEFWTRRLNALNESKIKVIDEFEKKFGKNVVCSKVFDFYPTTADLRFIYDVLNDNFFAGELKNIPVTMCTSANIADKINIYNAVSKNFEKPIDRCDCVGLHLAAVNDKVDAEGKCIDLDIFCNIIMLNRDYLRHNAFIFVVACMLHEMIHYCDSFSDEFRKKFFKYNQDPIRHKFDSHDDRIFQEKMKDANFQGINVVTQTTNDPQMDNARAHIVLKNVLGEDDDANSDIQINEAPGMMYIKNKRIGSGVLIMYD